MKRQKLLNKNRKKETLLFFKLKTYPLQFQQERKYCVVTFCQSFFFYDFSFNSGGNIGRFD